MNNTFYFLRHAKTKPDKNVPISQWVLSDQGEEQVKRLAHEGVFKDVDLIFSSTEQKAYQTAKAIADTLGKQIVQLSEIAEMNRDKGGFMQGETYEHAIKYALEHLDDSQYNWETASHALERFSKKIEELDNEYDDKKILIIGHAFTINMYFAKLLGEIDDVYKRFTTNTYGDWGIIKNQKVIKDIAKQ